MIRQSISDECDLLKKTLMTKSAEYGTGIFGPPRLAPNMTAGAGILVRLGDKMNRLERLLSGAVMPDAETIEDTILDLAGYCVLWRALVREKTAESEGGEC